MKNFFVFLLDTILPPHPDVVIVRAISKSLTSHPRELFINTLRVTTLFEYRNTEAGACIRAVKYHHHKKAAHLLGQALKTHLDTLSPETVVIPVPLSPLRFRQRGHNQVVSLLQAASATFDEDILMRAERSSQTTLTRAHRFANVNGVMKVAPAKIGLIEGKDVLIIDDVVTTGATLAEAGRAIAIARPASVHYLALAH